MATAHIRSFGIRRIQLGILLALLATGIGPGCGSGGGGGGGGTEAPAPPAGLVTLTSQSDENGSLLIDGTSPSLQLIDAETGAAVAGAEVNVVHDGEVALVLDPRDGYLPQFVVAPVHSNGSASPMVLVPSSSGNDVSELGEYQQIDLPSSHAQQFLATFTNLVASNLTRDELDERIMFEALQTLTCVSAEKGVKKLLKRRVIHVMTLLPSKTLGSILGKAKNVYKAIGAVGLVTEGVSYLVAAIRGQVYDNVRWDIMQLKNFELIECVGTPAPIYVVPHGLVEAAYQSGSGQIQGSVRSGGAPVTAAEVYLEPFEQLTHGQRTASDALGGYVFSNLPDGKYRVRARKPGQRSVAVDITIEQGVTATLDIDLPNTADAELAVEESTLYIVPASESPGVAIANRGTRDSISWTIENLPAWLTAGSAAGVLAPGQRTRISLRASSDATGIGKFVVRSGSSSIDVQVVVVDEAAQPDLVMSSLSLDVSSCGAGATLSVRCMITNAGPGAAPGSLLRTRLGVSTPLTVLDRILDAATVAPIASGDSVTVTRSVTIPVDLSPGTYFVGCTANANSAFGESGGDNNQQAEQLVVGSAAPTSYSITSTGTIGEAGGAMTFTVSRAGTLQGETVYVSTVQTEGSTNVGDYTGLSNQPLSFASGQGTKSISVSLSNDLVSETDETYAIIAQRNSTDPISTSLAKATFKIVDDDASSTTYSLSSASASIAEAVGSVTFTLGRSGSLPAETVYISTVQTEGSTNSADYVGKTDESVSFSAGQTAKSVSLSITNDSSVEADETFALIAQRNSTDSVNTYLAKAPFTILDDDGSTTTYTVTPTPTTVAEGAGTLTFTVSRSGSTPSETLYVSTAQTEGYTNSGDYTGKTNETLAFTSGQTSKTVTVTLTNDASQENSEIYALLVQRSSNDPVSTFLAKAVFTILDDDSATTYSISPSSTNVSENGGTQVFTVTRSGSTPSETLYVSTAQTEGFTNSSDYTGKTNESLAFTSGQTSKTVTVAITNDSSSENNETFALLVQRNTTDPTSTYLTKATFTIVDNDTSYSISPSSTNVNENAGTKTFTVSRSGSTPGETVYVSTAQTEGSTNSGDYTGKTNESLTFSSGQTSKTVTVSITNDSSSESTETFALLVQRNTTDPTSTYLTKATFTIVDDDTSYSISPSSTNVNENAGTKTFTISRSGSTPSETVYVSTAQTEGYTNSGDYTGKTNESLSFSSGQTSKTVTVSITNNSSSENNETFALLVQRNTTDSTSTYLTKATFTILDDDTSYSISPSSTNVNENAGTKTFTISRSGSTPSETVYVSTAQTEGYTNSGDYTGKTNESLSFTSGQTSKTVTVSITNDSSSENNETFALLVQRNTSDPTSTYLAKATFTIVSNE